jgi:hypothetical protein
MTVLENRGFHRDAPRAQVRLIVRRRSGDDSIEVFRITLCRHQSLPSAGRASVPIREPWPFLVVRRDDRLRRHSHLMDSAMFTGDLSFAR